MSLTPRSAPSKFAKIVLPTVGIIAIFGQVWVFLPEDVNSFSLRLGSFLASIIAFFYAMHTWDRVHEMHPEGYDLKIVGLTIILNKTRRFFIWLGVTVILGLHLIFPNVTFLTWAAHIFALFIVTIGGVLLIKHYW